MNHSRSRSPRYILILHYEEVVFEQFLLVRHIANILNQVMMIVVHRRDQNLIKNHRNIVQGLD